MTTNSATTHTVPTAELAATWCRMWNEDSSLAHRLVTDDFRVWFGSVDPTTPLGDDLRGPQALADLVTAARAANGAVFTPRSMVVDDSGSHFGYVWDVTTRDGKTETGIDVCHLVDGKIDRNWSVTGERHSPVAWGLTDPHEPADRPGVERLCHAWTPLWNGAVDTAADVVTDDFGIWFAAANAASGDAVRGPADFGAWIEGHLERLPGLRFAEHGDLVIDTAHQTAAFTWTATRPTPDGDRTVGGVDAFELSDGRFARTWSVTGKRPFTF